MGRNVDIVQALTNLCTNSVLAMEKKKGVVSIEIVKDREVDSDLFLGRQVDSSMSAAIVVSDTGKGMDSEIMQLACEPFFTTRCESIGLGLAVALRIAEDHMGGISIKSRPGERTSVGLVIPRLSRDTKSSTTVDELKPEEVEGGEHIMLVDDDEQVLKMGQRLLASMGYQVTVYADPLLALESFMKSPGLFDIVVTDFRMPVMNGLQLAKRILYERRDIPVLFISGDINKSDMDEARRAGVRGLSRKPFEADELAARLRRIIDDSKRISFH